MRRNKKCLVKRKKQSDVQAATGRVGGNEEEAKVPLSLFFNPDTTTTDVLIHFVLRFLPVKLHTGVEDAAGSSFR